MILLSLGLLAFAIADLLRGPRDQAGKGDGHPLLPRTAFAVVAAGGLVGAISALAGSRLTEAALVSAVAVVVLAVWGAFDYELFAGLPLLPLVWASGTLVGLAAISSLGDSIEGPLGDWYAGLDFAFVSEVSPDQFLLGCGAALFAIASCNRVVTLMLELAATSLKEDDSSLKGGRFLGPMERLIVGAAILGGDPAAAAIVIAAKGLLRFPEIQKGSRSPDADTEYFLVGTLSSLLLAGALALLISATT